MKLRIVYVIIFFPSFFFFLSLYTHPHPRFDKRRKKKKKKKKLLSRTQTFCDFVRNYFSPREKEWTAFFPQMLRSKDFASLHWFSIRFFSRSGTWFLKGKESGEGRKERNKRKYTCNRGFTRVKGRRNIVLATLLVEDNFQESRRRPSRSNVNAK